MTIAYYTGMRMREIISERGLRWEQVNLEEGSIRLSSSQTKTKIPRVIYMADDFLRVMLKAKELQARDYPACPYVCHRNGKPFDNLIQGWKAACKRVGLDGLTFHDLRRTGVRNLVRAGVPETVAMKISGHKTRSVFDRYNITSEDDLREAAKKLNRYILEKKVTVSVTVADILGESVKPSHSQPIEMWRWSQSAANPSLPVIPGNREKYREYMGCQGFLRRSDRRKRPSHASFCLLFASRPSLRTGN